MTKSMTGFGSANGEVGGGRLEVEAKSVNHRHLNVQVKVPYNLQPFESQVRRVVRDFMDRGHVTVFARWGEEPPREATVRVDIAKAQEYFGAMRQLQNALGTDEPISCEFIARQNGVFTTATEEEAALEWAEVETVLRAALAPLDQSRTHEGDVLAKEIESRLTGIEFHLAQAEQRAPQRLTEEKLRLQQAVTDLTEGLSLPEERIALEIAVLADRLDVTEEIVRLRAHLDASRAALDRDEPVGKHLGFLAQEMLREINTMGSKANDAAMAHAAVAMKGDLEKIREQVENLE